MTLESGPIATDTGVRARVIAEFERRFGGTPTLLARAPGRVNLIGDHTDYNEGFVLPMAIDRAVWIALRPRVDRRVRVRSLDFAEEAELDLAAAALTRREGAPRAAAWAEYVRGIAVVLSRTDEDLRGWDGVAGGDVPIGAGLSSSAALELASARAFAGVSHLRWNPAAMARVAQRAENDWVGVNCGIMDQLISASGAAEHALLIDCRSLESRQVPIPAGAAVVVLDTGTKRGLVDSAYNERRAQCEAAARFFGVRALRDVDVATFEARADALDPVARRRARHVITENARTTAAAAALERGDLHEMGRLMDASHASLRDDFEVSSPELDRVAEIARAHPACLGARMTGAGFGGCAVALADRAGASELARDVAARYERDTGVRGTAYLCAASAGASLEVVSPG